MMSSVRCYLQKVNSEREADSTAAGIFILIIVFKQDTMEKTNIMGYDV